MVIENADTWIRTSSLQPIITTLARVVRGLQTSKTNLSRVEKFARCAALFPVFSLLVFILRLRAALGKPPIDVVSRTSAGFVFRCRPPDLIQMYLWLFGVWEPELTAFITSRLATAEGFLDVGANIGYFSVLAAERVGEKGAVISVEPSPTVFPLLEETIQLNARGARVRAINAAAARRVGSMAIYSGPSHNIGLTTTVAERGFELEGVIPSLPLDAVLTSEEKAVLRMIKIDVEGREPDVLRGMEDLIRDSREDLEVLLELSPNWWSDSTLAVPDVLQLFLSAGFNVYEITNSYWPWRYLWPRRVSRPKRRRSRLPRRADRLDLVLSRRDADFL
jgi:FkbM family methyltransferase